MALPRAVASSRLVLIMLSGPRGFNSDASRDEMHFVSECAALNTKADLCCPLSPARLVGDICYVID